ncbi:ATP-binding protein [Sulfuriferula nivalis]|uniref:histidine kinase n=1 Tax=Sulfuriferula nivalis TaxID=2675298 RepID=A0A809RFS3_9PROT|nr:ATP-binding protein [Sulfuriferula nivalis]BBO99723.1 hypothetical protein SFSGTM_04320 [Sulfuriferula nivalis]
MTFDRMSKLSWIYDLYRLGQDVTMRAETASIYQQIIVQVVGGFEGKSGSLALCNADGTELSIVAGIDLPEEVVGSSVKMGTGVLGWVAQNGKALLLNGDATNDIRFERVRDVHDLVFKSVSSAICWPLKIENRVIGAISVNRLGGQVPYTYADLEQGIALLNMVSLALANMQLHLDRNLRLEEMQQINTKLEAAQNQLLQSEKMASIGQLAAGVAHEINNPIGYVYSNLSSLEKYILDLFDMVDAYEHAESAILDDDVREQLQSKRNQLDLAFLKADLRELMSESKEGITRVKQIVQNLKDFSHVDATDEWHFADLRVGIESTLNIVNNEIKYKAKVIKEYGDIPDVECLSSQLNQVFMNLLVNAAHAIEERGEISIHTGMQGNEVWVEISDSGHGITPENMNRIFDPFFTTKPVGKGTGLGLSLSYGIIQKHHGRIEVKSEVGKGSVFTVWLPIKHEES